MLKAFMFTSKPSQKLVGSAAVLLGVSTVKETAVKEATKNSRPRLRQSLVLLLLLGHFGCVGLPLLVVVLDEALGVGSLGLLSGFHALAGKGLSEFTICKGATEAPKLHPALK